ncbi:hypothetical protein GPALN_006080 [Globodera pallida]|nr:hypothetical protein GPALN_006080 [Globodera pallida]
MNTAFLAFLKVYDPTQPLTHTYPATEMFGTPAFIENNVYGETLKNLSVHLSSIVADQAGENSSTTTEKERALLMTLFVAEEGKRAHRQHQTVGGIHHSGLKNITRISMFFKIFLFLFGIFVVNRLICTRAFRYELGKEDVSAPFARKASGGCERVVVGESQRRRRPPPLVIVCAEFNASPKTSGPEAPTLKQPNSRRFCTVPMPVSKTMLLPNATHSMLKIGGSAPSFTTHSPSSVPHMSPSNVVICGESTASSSDAGGAAGNSEGGGNGAASGYVAGGGEGPSGSASGGSGDGGGGGRRDGDRQRQNTHAIDNGGGRGKLRWKQQQEKQEKMLAAQQAACKKEASPQPTT